MVNYLFYDICVRTVFLYAYLRFLDGNCTYILIYNVEFITRQIEENFAEEATPKDCQNIAFCRVLHNFSFNIINIDSVMM